MNTIDEMMKTFESAWRDHVDAEADAEFSLRDEAQVALIAVIEKHIADMVQSYYEDGFNDGYAQGKSSRGVSKATVVHDVRPAVLSALTATGRE